MIMGDKPTGRASLDQIRAAASGLLLKCGSVDPSQGGIAYNIGKARSLCFKKQNIVSRDSRVFHFTLKLFQMAIITWP